MTKEYYLKPSYAYSFALVGMAFFSIFAIIFFSFLSNLSFSNTSFLALQMVLFLFSVALFLIPGVLHLKNSKKIIRAKIDEKGFYFKRIPKDGSPSFRIGGGSEFFLTFFWLRVKFTFIPFKKLWHAEYFEGDGVTHGAIDVHTDEGVETIYMMGHLSETDMKDLAKTLNQEIQRFKKNNK